MSFASMHNDYLDPDKHLGNEEEYFDFPRPSCDGTKWGPTDFYDDVRENLGKAFDSGLDFETGWLCCKKEILSSQIVRVENTVTVSVSVSDDFDTEGVGHAEGKVPKTKKAFFNLLERLGEQAHAEASDAQKDNRCFCGYSVGRKAKDGTPKSWEFTYLVSVAGFDVPSGDNYHRWGWQEVDTDDDQDIDARPEKIPAKVAAKLAEGMQQFEPIVTAGGWVATIWKD